MFVVSITVKAFLTLVLTNKSVLGGRLSFRLQHLHTKVVLRQNKAWTTYRTPAVHVVCILLTGNGKLQTTPTENCPLIQHWWHLFSPHGIYRMMHDWTCRRDFSGIFSLMERAAPCVEVQKAWITSTNLCIYLCTSCNLKHLTLNLNKKQTMQQN